MHGQRSANRQKRFSINRTFAECHDALVPLPRKGPIAPAMRPARPARNPACAVGSQQDIRRPAILHDGVACFPVAVLSSWGQSG